MDTNDILNNLQKLGLNIKESKVLTVVLQYGEISLSDIEKKTDIPRSTVHRIISSLIKIGYVTWTLGSQGKRVKSGNFSMVVSDIKAEKEQLENKEDIIHKLSENLPDIKISITSRPQVSYFEGIEGIKQLIWNTLSSNTTLRVYTNAMRKEIVGEKWFINYTNEFVQRNIKDKVLADTEFAKDSYQKYGGREAYFSPVKKFYDISDERVYQSGSIKIKGETYIYNDVLAMYTWEKGELIGAEIKSKFISSTQASIFDFLWGTTTENDSIDRFIS